MKITAEEPLGSASNPIKIGHFLDLARCPYSFYLEYLDPTIDPMQLPIKGTTVQSEFIKRAIKGLFKKDNSLKYASPRSFASVMSWRWIRYTLADGDKATSENRPIVWRDFKEIERSLETIIQCCYNYHSMLLGEGYSAKPIPGQPLPLVLYDQPDKKTNYKEHFIQFSFGGLAYTASLNEIWKGGRLIINGLPRALPRQKELEKDLIYTLLALAYCTKASDNVNYRLFWGLDENFIHKLNGSHLTDELSIVYRHLFSGNQFELSRSEDSLVPFQEASSNLEKLAAQAEDSFSPNPASCYTCKFNTLSQEGNIPCKKANLKYGPIKYSLAKGAIYGIKLGDDRSQKVGDRVKSILDSLEGPMGNGPLTGQKEIPSQP